MARTKKQSSAKAATKQSIADVAAPAASTPAADPAAPASAASSSSSATAADPPAKSNGSGSTYSATELLDKAEAILDESGEVELAAKFAERARAQCATDEERARCSEVMGMCCLENGEEEQAKQLFESCRATSSTALLYLAQLADSPQEAIANFKAAVDLLSTKVDLTGGSGALGKDRAWSPQEREIRVQISRALVGMTELYLTDLCMEADAEARCTEYLDLALRVDAGADINPEIYITLASVRLSQCRPEDALGSLTRSFSIWKDEPPTSPSIPTFVARLNLARLFVECEAYAEAIEVLEGLEDEDDEEFEVLYLLGLANWLIGEKATEEAERREAYIDSREVLERFLQIQQRKPKECDRDMAAQVKELVATLEKTKKITMKDVEEQAARMAEAEAAGLSAKGGTGVADEDGWEDEDGDDGDDDDDEMQS